MGGEKEGDGLTGTAAAFGIELRSSVIIPQIDAFTEILPNAAVYHIGMFSNRASSQPIQYYNRLPKDRVSDLTFVLDPLIATGAFVDTPILGVLACICFFGKCVLGGLD